MPISNLPEEEDYKECPHCKERDVDIDGYCGTCGKHMDEEKDEEEWWEE